MSEPKGLTLLIDAQALQGADPERGIPRWLGEFVRSVRKRKVRCVGLTNPSLHSIHPQFKDCFDDIFANRRNCIRQFTDGGPTVYVVGSALEPVRPVRALLPDHVLESGVPIATVMYDLALYRYPEYYQTRPGDDRTYAARRTIFRWSDRFLAISESTARDLIDLWNVPAERVTVVGSGVSEFFRSSASPSTRNPSQFVLTVGRRDPRKQTAFLIRMFAGLPAGLRSELKLVVVCRLDDEIAQTWRSLAHELGLHGDQLVLTGLIDDARLRDLYRHCEVFVEPSQFEGFGLPLAEAAACGAVAICSNTSSLPEVIPTSENLFDPTDLRAATALLEDALTKSQLRTRLREAAHQSQQTHRWDAVADRALTILAAMAREVEVPQASLADYLRRGFPVGAIGRTIPQACIDD